MTRINTNVSSLNAQKTLARSNAMLQESLTRLSTGLRINTGKDDPAGLIASEVLRSDIIGVQRAITNSQRANQMIATADSALGQVSSLLNDIRGLISEAANTGAMSAEQISANQLQIDSSLEAIDRIAQVTQFQGRRLLDGSLDFITEGIETDKVTDLQIDQANFGTQPEVGVAVEVVQQATRAELHYEHGAIADDVVLEIGGKNGFEAFNFAGGSTIEDLAKAINLVADALGIQAEVQQEATQGSIVASSYGVNNDIIITADEAGLEPGNLRIKYTADPTGNDAPEALYTPPAGEEPGLIEIKLETEKWAKAVYEFGTDDGTANNGIRFTAKQAGIDYNDFKFTFAQTGVGNEDVTIDVPNKTISIDGGASATVAALITNVLSVDAEFMAMFDITDSIDGGSDTGNFQTGGPLDPDTYQVTEGVDGGTILSTANDVVAMINDESGPLYGVVSAALAEGNDGYHAVTAFQEFAYYGDVDADNRLQFLGPEDTRDIRFVSNPGQELGVDMSSAPRILGFASAIVQGTEPDTNFKITARQKGEDFDDVQVIMNDQATEVAEWNPEKKTLTINVNLTAGATTLNTVIGLVNTDPIVSKYFRAEIWGTATGSAQFNGNSANLDDMAVSMTGGVESEGSVIINLETNEAGLVQTTANDLIAFFDDTASHNAEFAALGVSVSNVQGSDGSGILAATEEDLVFSTSGTDLQRANASATTVAANGDNAIFQVNAKTAGPEYDGITIEFEDTATSGSETVEYDATTKTITVSIDAGTTDAKTICDIINGTSAGASEEVLELFEAEYALDLFGLGDSDGLGKLSVNDHGTFSGGTTDAGSEYGAALLGNEDQANTGLKFMAVEYGSDAFVSVRALNGTSFNVVDQNGDSKDRVNGTDVDARINGIQAVGKGLTAMLNTSSLDLSFSLADTVTDGDSMNFRIVGGGAQFQLGPDVVSNQQARLGIGSVNTAKLGGVAGRLFELRSGGPKDLETDVISAAMVIEEVITQVTTLRGRLGAFQRTTLETNIASLSDTLEALTEAESSIRDSDFAQESANLTRNQILVQSGISVLTIANQNPEAVLSLLR